MTNAVRGSRTVKSAKLRLSMKMSAPLLTLSLLLTACSSHRTEPVTASPAASAADTLNPYRVRDTLPDTTAAGRRDTTTQR
jgi:hypothetical protein